MITKKQESMTYTQKKKVTKIVYERAQMLDLKTLNNPL